MQQLQKDGRSFKGSPYCKRGHPKEYGKDCAECNRLRCKTWYNPRRHPRPPKPIPEKQKRIVARLCKRGHMYPVGRRGGCADCAKMYFRCREANKPRFGTAAAMRTLDGRKRCPVGHIHNERRCPQCFDAYIHDWHDRNPDAMGSYSSARRARRKGAFGSHTREEWDAIVAFQKGRCAECGAKGKLERDHIVPLLHGGSDLTVNIQGLCRTCNRKKSHKLPAGTQLGVFDSVSRKEHHG